MSVGTHDEITYLAEVAVGEAGFEECGCERGIRLTLPTSSLTAWQIKDVIAAIFMAGLVLVFAQLPFAAKPSVVVVSLLCLAPSALEILVLNSVRHKRYSLHVYPERLVVSQGWAFRQVITIPRSSILHLRFRQGPVLRGLGLTNVSILTIADHQKIGPLDSAQAELVKSFVNGDLHALLT